MIVCVLFKVFGSFTVYTVVQMCGNHWDYSLFLFLPGEKGTKGEKGEPGIGERGVPGPTGPIGNDQFLPFSIQS